MITKNNIRTKYKQLLKLRINVQNRQKIIKFKKKKWNFFVDSYKKSLKWYNKFKPKNQTQYRVSRIPKKFHEYKKRYKFTLEASKQIQLLYGGVRKKLLKKTLKTVNKNYKTNYHSLKLELLKHFEQRLDSTLYKAKFCNSIKTAKQLISHGKVYINNKRITYSAYSLKTGDIISIDHNYHNLIEKNIKKFQYQLWPIPPKHLVINYKTLEIYFGDLSSHNYSTDFNHYIDLEKILINYYHH